MSKKNSLFLTILLLLILSAGLLERIRISRRTVNYTDLTKLQDFTQNKSIEREDPQGAYLSSSKSQGYGLAKRIYIDGKFFLTINTNLPSLDPSQIYEAWIMESSAEKSSQKSFPLGKLTFTGEDFFLFYQSADDLRSARHIVITKQTTNDETPEEIMLEGSF